MNEEIPSNSSFWKEQFTMVTTFSKYVALTLFIAFPFVGLWLGTQLSTDFVNTEPQIATSEQKPLTTSPVLENSDTSNIPEHCVALNNDDYISCLSEYAKENLDFELCKKIPNYSYEDSSDRTSCMSQVAQKLKDVSLCIQILMYETDGFSTTTNSVDSFVLHKGFSSVTDCYSQIGIELQNETICNMIPSVIGWSHGERFIISERDECLGGIAKATGDVSLCKKMEDDSISEYYKNKDVCYAEVAEVTQNYSICENISSWPKYFGGYQFCYNYARSIEI